LKSSKKNKVKKSGKKNKANKSGKKNKANKSGKNKANKSGKKNNKKSTNKLFDLDLAEVNADNNDQENEDLAELEDGFELEKTKSASSTVSSVTATVISILFAAQFLFSF